ncbi:type II toxin-antitoxin system VapC family toxin [Dongia sp.]|uniref:type II toxin-antitoxin system VapC family toxin n=1 Tax=Dongia sp. TaxID=1977262 RepID=UPI0035B01AC7
MPEREVESESRPSRGTLETSGAAKLRNFLQPSPNSKKLKFGGDLIIASTAIVRGATIVSFNVADYQAIHQHFDLPGLYHPGRQEWMIEYNPDKGYTSR